MRFQHLSDWLAWQETLHPSRIKLGLERVRQVWRALHPGADPYRAPFAVITVGGTNGKGSCVAYLDAWYRAAGYRCGTYTSPHLLRYNERIRVGGESVSDTDLCAAFERIDRARGETVLTYFEFGTLAALDIFVRAGLDIAVLEVGLGGRLDAVNLIDADVAIVASVGFDHMAWLGDNLEAIATEKAGIFRPGCRAVIGQRDAPAALRRRAEEVGAQPVQLGQEYQWRAEPAQWSWKGEDAEYRALPMPALRGRHQLDNASAALAATDALKGRIPVSPAAIRQGLLRARLPGRFTVIAGAPTWILDVAHNQQAAVALAENLSAFAVAGRRVAVLSLLSDKDARAVAAPLAGLIDHWHLAPAPSDRAMAMDAMANAVSEVASDSAVARHPDLHAALHSAADEAAAEDLILIFGSFVTVEAAMRSPILPSV